MLFGNVIYYGSKLTTRSETSVHLWPGLKIFSLSPNVGSNPVMFFQRILILIFFCNYNFIFGNLNNCFSSRNAK